jgi:hypothetical protein
MQRVEMPRWRYRPPVVFKQMRCPAAMSSTFPINTDQSPFLGYLYPANTGQ